MSAIAASRSVLTRLSSIWFACQHLKQSPIHFHELQVALVRTADT